MQDCNKVVRLLVKNDFSIMLKHIGERHTCILKKKWMRELLNIIQVLAGLRALMSKNAAGMF